MGIQCKKICTLKYLQKENMIIQSNKMLISWTDNLMQNLQQQEQKHIQCKKICTLQHLQKENMIIQSNINTSDHELNILHSAINDAQEEEKHEEEKKSNNINRKLYLIDKNEILKDKIYLLQEKQKQYQQLRIMKGIRKKIKKHTYIYFICALTIIYIFFIFK